MIVASRFPLGFLDLVGAQNFGENPRILAEFVQPVVDIGEQYLVSSQVIVTGSIGAAANNFNALSPSGDFAVPTGEVWRLLAYSASVATGAGVTGTFAPALRATTTGGPRAMLSTAVDFTASRTFWVAAAAVPIWLPAGTQLGIEVQNLAGGNPAMSGTAIYSRLRA